MQTDNQYIISSFERNFSKCKNKRIAIYGKGPYTKLILDIFRNYNILGIMDRDMKSGIIYDKAILSYDDLLEQKIEIIIVVSRPDSIETIFKRINNFCVINHIQLYGINGSNLFETFKNDDEDIIDKFEKFFSSCKSKNIVLYGKGPRTRLILESFPHYNILGIMDKKMKHGWCYGKPIISYDEVQELNVDMIISVTRPCSTSHVYNRLAKFCSYNKISFYDVYGNNLFAAMGKAEEEEIEPHSYFEVSEDNLKKQIIEHEIISFDVFDTLIMRKTLRPIDVFEIVEDRAKQMGIPCGEFHLFRRKAERECSKSNPTIYDIYEALQGLSGITNKEKEDLLVIELEIEKQVLVRREQMVEIMKYAIQLKKKVYLISDMYLPAIILTEILEGLDVVGYEKLFVSCDYKICKWDGLFKSFKDEVKGSSYLHIGDNEVADGVCSRQQGLDAFEIKSALDLLEISGYANIRSYLTNVNERSLLGMFLAKAFNNPFALYKSGGRLSIDQAYDLSYLFVSPLITSFMVWMINEVEKNRYDDLLFASRDGYLIQKLYDFAIEKLNINNMPKGLYFQTSREVAMKISVIEDEDIEWLCILPYKDELHTVIQKKFHLDDCDVVPFDPKLYENTIAYGLAHKDVIINKSNQMKTWYLEYIKKTGLTADKKYAMFDLVASGTCQDSLVKIVPFELEGIYLCNYDNPSGKGKNLSIKSMITEHRNVQDNSYASYARDSYIYGSYNSKNGEFKNYVFLETILTSLEPSLVDVSENGDLVFAEENRTLEEQRFIKDTQAAIEDYFKDYITVLYIRGINIDYIIGDELYKYKDIKYTNEHCKILDDFGLHDDLGLGRFPVMRH